MTTDRGRFGSVSSDWATSETTVGGQFHRNPDATVRAVCDLDDAALRDEVGRGFGVSADQQYAEYEAMLAEASLDAVLVGTPHTPSTTSKSSPPSIGATTSTATNR